MPYNDYKGDTLTEFEVIFYEKENGDCPVENLLEKSFTWEIFGRRVKTWII